MSVARGDLSIYQGNDYAAVVSVFDPSGPPADIVGYTARAQIRRQVADKDPVVVAELHVTVVPPQVLLSLTHDETQPLFDVYVWDLELTAPDGTITTILAGSVKVTREVTRPETVGVGELSALVRSARERR